MGDWKNWVAEIPVFFRENTNIHIIPLVVFVHSDTITFPAWCNLSKLKFEWEEQMAEEETEWLSM